VKAHSNSAYKPLWVLFAILLGVTAITAISKFVREGSDRIPWRQDVSAAAEEARRDGKPRLLYFTASWCGPCQKMKGETWSDGGVEAKLRAYVPVKIDIDQNPALAQQHAIDSLPTMIVLDRDGNPVKRTSGFMTPSAILAWLNS
jgi:thiol:disulfide interchange protein